MHILAIDTATNSGGVALSRGAELVDVRMLQPPRCYSEKVISAVDSLLTHHNLEMSDIDCLVASVGPGSFTGIRIGLATVKAFCQPLAKPVVGISTLAALACRFSHLSRYVAPMMDAGRKQIYGAVYRIEGSEMYIESPEQVLSPARWLASVPASHCLFAGDGVAPYKGLILSACPEARVLETDNRLVEQLCLLGHRYFVKGDILEAQELAANYIRPSDAELGALSPRHSDRHRRDLPDE